MTAQHDDLIRAFIAEGRDDLPDRAFDAVRGEIHRTRQRVVIGPWREPQMSNVTRYALVAAAVVAVLVGASRLWPAPSGPGTTEPSPTPSPTGAAPSPSPELLCSTAGRCSLGSLEPGAYSFALTPYGEIAPTRISFTVPAGWTADDDWYVLKHDGAADELMFTVWEVTHLYPDA